MTPAHRELLREFQDFAQTAPSTQSFMELIAKRLHEKVTRYNWTGFYLIDPADSGYLVVGPYAGSFTPNARIPLATGLCGAAATSGQVVVVQDVSKDPRYLSGSSLVKSEIVIQLVPVRPVILIEALQLAGQSLQRRNAGRGRRGFVLDFVFESFQHPVGGELGALGPGALQLGDALGHFGLRQ